MLEELRNWFQMLLNFTLFLQYFCLLMIHNGLQFDQSRRTFLNVFKRDLWLVDLILLWDVALSQVYWKSSFGAWALFLGEKFGLDRMDWNLRIALAKNWGLKTSIFVSDAFHEVGKFHRNPLTRQVLLLSHLNRIHRLLLQQPFFRLLLYPIIE